MRPSTRVRLGLRAALRRTYGYAALRVLRRSVRAALADHRARSVGAGSYDGTRELKAIRAHYRRAVKRLLQRWPALQFSDERSEP
jgi:hypothetical protein